MPNRMSFVRGDFSFLTGTTASEKVMLEDAFQGMNRVEGSWEYLARPDVPEKENGFMFSKDPMITKISSEIDKDGAVVGHSGASYGWTMRQMEYIAKHGWDAYVNLRVENQRKREEEEKARKAAEKPPRIFNEPFFNEMRAIPHFNEQIEAAERVAASQGGKLSYAQMRELMG